MGPSETLQRWLLRAGVVISAVLLIRFGVDFGDRMAWWLAVPFESLIAATLVVAGESVFAASRSPNERTGRQSVRLLLIAAIPLGFLASALGCSGLAPEGCSPFCTFVKLVWIPLIAVACGVYLKTDRRGWLTVICLMSFVPLFPHCVCYNVGNAWWIERLGASPVCYVWGFAVGVIAVASLRREARRWPAVAISCAVIAGATAFFVSHHYFHFPW